MPPPEILLFVPGEDALGALADVLAPLIAKGDLVLLEGPLGAGKTALARALLRHWANDARLEVPSPSFALVQPYQTDAGPVLHADLYRLVDPREIDELGLDDDPMARVLVEWPGRAPELAARANLVVTLGVPKDGAGRTLLLEFATGAALDDKQKLAQKFAPWISS